jgi:hypothetical protein
MSSWKTRWDPSWWLSPGGITVCQMFLASCAYTILLRNWDDGDLEGSGRRRNEKSLLSLNCLLTLNWSLHYGLLCLAIRCRAGVT